MLIFMLIFIAGNSRSIKHSVVYTKKQTSDATVYNYTVCPLIPCKDEQGS